MNDKINGIIVNSKVYTVGETEYSETCKKCDLQGTKCDGCCTTFGTFSFFKFSQELTDNLQLNERRRIKLNGK